MNRKNLPLGVAVLQCLQNIKKVKLKTNMHDVSSGHSAI